MERQEALKMMLDNVQNPNLRKHILAVEAVMRRLARRLGQDEERWGLAGLLHDVDYEATKDSPERHSLVGAEMLARAGLDEEIVDAVRAHNDYHGLERRTLMAKALYAADPLTGLIVAAALISPAKKLSAIDTQFVLNRFGEKAFARGARREPMLGAKDELGLELEELISLGLEAMQGISGELGL
ncbi:MAG: HDIG domain-containing protein [Firmicutes bacterium]|nr:HDIG domain-containing protein [Bacillota bacterium]